MQIITHYTTLDVALQSIVRNKSLKFGKLNTMNDPYEVDLFRYGSSGRLLCRNESEQKIFDAKSNLQQSYLRTRVSCFCSGNNSNNNHHLWTHYGDRLKGVCTGCALMFDCDRLINSVELHKECIKKYSGPITYCKTSGLDSVFGNDLFQMLKTKHKRWENESEFRIVIETVTSDASDIFVNFNDALIGIVVGIDQYRSFDNDYIEHVRNQHANMRWFSRFYDWGSQSYIVKEEPT